jgi:hypothetical protein
MTDIVERLRRCADRERPYGPVSDICDEAAAEIERLRAALEEIFAQDDAAACCGKGRGYGDQLECCGNPEYGIDRAQRIARAALAKEGE